MTRRQPSNQPKDSKDYPSLQECAYRVYDTLWVDHKDRDGRLAAAMKALETLRQVFNPGRLRWDDLEAPGVRGRMVEDMRASGVSSSTINRRLSALKAVYVGAGLLGLRQGPRSLPDDAFPFLKEPAGRTRVVSIPEYHRLLVHRDESDESIRYFTTLVALLYESGLRVSEALALTWNEVDLERKTILVRESKNGTSRTVPITADLLTRLHRFRGLAVLNQDTMILYNGDRRLFKVSQSSFNEWWSNARRMMGLQDDREFVPHALRHTCATRLVLSGVPLPVVQRWMGHKSIQTTMRYAHVHDDALMDAAERVGRITR